MILDDLAEYSRFRVEKAKEKVSLEDIKRQALNMEKGSLCFEKAIRKKGLSFICEVKKASPSKGIIDEEFDYISIAKDYENIGADAVSCLTEPKWFLGSNEIFKEIRNSISLPMIRKDFTVDEYQIYESKVIGADAVLLICSILNEDTIRRFLCICDELGLSAVVETHNEEEVRSAIRAGSRIIGVNNRNLKDFTVDIKNAQRMRNLVPNDILFIAESGVKSSDDIKEINNMGASAVLIGETMMKSRDRRGLIKKFKGECD